MLASKKELREGVQKRLAKLKKGDLFDVGGSMHYIFIRESGSKGVYFVIELNASHRILIVNNHSTPWSLIDFSHATYLNVNV
ncbi:MAG: hypothetical protein AUJ25_03305 [Parcubacteria group bacterium CG1_02_37_13]|nr:MAG: hypothetical protein AUJ25_03305 [Parcubacteria group bacterium CG1_02_37_13]